MMNLPNHPHAADADEFDDFVTAVDDITRAPTGISDRLIRRGPVSAQGSDRKSGPLSTLSKLSLSSLFEIGSGGPLDRAR